MLTLRDCTNLGGLGRLREVLREKWKKKKKCSTYSLMCPSTAHSPISHCLGEIMHPHPPKGCPFDHSLRSNKMASNFSTTSGPYLTRHSHPLISQLPHCTPTAGTKVKNGGRGGGGISTDWSSLFKSSCDNIIWPIRMGWVQCLMICLFSWEALIG